MPPVASATQPQASGRVYGYARASAHEQKDALKQAGCRAVRSDLDILVDDLRQGDTLVVTRLGNLAPSIREVLDLVKGLDAKGVVLKVTEQPCITGCGENLLDMLGVFVEFAAVAPKQWPRDENGKPKVGGFGRPATIDPEKVRELRRKGMKPAAIASELKMSVPYVYRILADQKR